MGLTNALQIGRSGLLASQAALQVAGNNLANVGTEGYNRQRINLTGAGVHDVGQGNMVGRGVQVESIQRIVDEALQARLRKGESDQAATEARKNVLEQVESIYNELSDNDLSTHLNEFFNAWSELANRPDDLSLRSLVVAEGDKLAQFVQRLHHELSELRKQTDGNIEQSAKRADDLLDELGTVNRQIVEAEATRGSAHSLRDERDRMLGELSELIDINTVEQSSGSVDVFVGSTPILLNGKNRGLELKRETVEGDLTVSLQVKADGTKLDPKGGRLGALVDARLNDLDGALEHVDTFANQLIFQVNRIHSQGQGMEGFNKLIAGQVVDDPDAPLASEAAGLPFNPDHGSFRIHVTQKSTGYREATQIDVDLDGIGEDTSLNDLAAAIDAVDNVSAKVRPDGRLEIEADGGDFEISFDDDSSGILAALGIGTFFTGSDARHIAVDGAVSDNLRLLAAGQDHVEGDNSNAKAMDRLRDEPVAGLDNLSLTQSWRRHVEDVAVAVSQANNKLESNKVVLDNLKSQREANSGVNVDEEAINLMAFQRAFQGNARFLSVVDEMMQTLMALV